ncbi:MAG: PAS domain-containing protein [Spirochaetaceae bacterium]|jgi:PAS domain S-box-containing protein|nr:PAS domain-containing protein [Spirochaetaceae bacterium]
MFQTINASNDIVFWKFNTKTGRQTLAGNWKDLCGWTIDEFKGKNAAAALAASPQDLAAIDEMKRAAAESPGNEVRSVEVRLKRKDGGIIWVQDAAYVSKRGKDGKALILRGVLRDITYVKRAVDMVYRKQENLDLVADIVKLSYWEWDAVHDILLSSRQVETALGYMPEDLKSLGIQYIPEYIKNKNIDAFPAGTFIGIIHPEDRYILLNVIDDYMRQTIRHFRKEFRLLNKKGDYVWVIASGYLAEYDKENGIEIVRGAILNIDDSKQAEMRALESAAKLAQYKEHMDIVAEMSHLAYFEWDVIQDSLDSASIHLLRELGYREGEIKGFGFEPRENPTAPYYYIELIHPEDRAKRSESLDLCLKGISNSYQAEVRVRGKNGEYLWTKAYGYAAEWEDGLPSKIIGGIININALRRAENLNKAKSAFLARMSHEIRTPMNAITGMSELILRENISPRIREYASGVQQAGANLLSLINDILDFSKIESGNLKIVNAPYLFASLINDVINIIRLRLREKQLIFTVNISSGIPQRLTGDVTRIRQIMLNLLNNAAKYTDKGYVALDITAARQEAGDNNYITIEVKVTDSGRGIKPEDTEKLFGEFIQVDIERNHNIEGTGLGLAIAGNLAHAMNGTITVESVYGEGSCFTFTIPQIVEEEQRIAVVENAAEKRVLLYEARERYAASLKRCMDDLNVFCTVVSSYQQLKTELADGRYNWLFAASPLYESAYDLIKKTNAQAKIAALGDASGIYADVVIPLPAHAISIANILNNSKSADKDEPEHTTFGFAAPGARILIVDDILTNLVVAEGLLAPYQMRVNTSLSGQDAITLIKELAQKDEYFDALFIDHMMPGMDGIETAQAVRALALEGYGDIFNTIPIIAFTANAIIGMREIFLENGFTDYIVKPIDIKKMDEALRAAIPAEKQISKHYAVAAPEYGVQARRQLRQEIAQINDIDVPSALEHVRTEENLIKVLKQFVSEFNGYVNGIYAAMQSESWEDYGIKVHAVKGVLATIGNAPLSQRARELEMAVKEGNYPFCRAKTAALCEGLTAFHEALKKTALAHEEPGDAKTAISPATFIKKLQELHEAAFKFNSDESERLIEQLVKIEPDDASMKELWEKAAPSIQAKITEFDYDRAAAEIQTILNLTA